MKTIYGIVALSPRKWIVVQLTSGTTMLSGVPVENCDSAGKIVFGPTTKHFEATDFLISVTAVLSK